MSPRNKKRGGIKFCCLFFCTLVLLFNPSGVLADNIFIKFYQDHISVVDGNRCPMHPSCSTYAAHAIEKHGPLIGWIMACDRLVRCGRDEKHIAGTIIRDNQVYVPDTIDSNDFWWFNKE